VQETQLQIDAPASLALKYETQILPQVKVGRQEENGRMRVSITQGAMEALEKGERYLPSEQLAYPQVSFSEASVMNGSAIHHAS